MLTLVIMALWSVSLPVTFLAVYKDSDGNVVEKLCTVDFSTNEIIRIVLIYIGLIFYTAAPFLLMLLFNIILSVTLVAAAAKVGLFTYNLH